MKIYKVVLKVDVADMQLKYLEYTEKIYFSVVCRLFAWMRFSY